MAYHVSKTRFAELVEQSLAELPSPFKEHLEQIAVEIKDRPSRKLLKSLEMEEDELLLGLYCGQSLDERSVLDGAMMPERIFIFQEVVETVCDSEADVIREVRITVLHEIGHHFGMTEDDLEAYGYD